MSNSISSYSNSFFDSLEKDSEQLTPISSFIVLFKTGVQVQVLYFPEKYIHI